MYTPTPLGTVTLRDCPLPGGRPRRPRPRPVGTVDGGG